MCVASSVDSVFWQRAPVVPLLMPRFGRVHSHSALAEYCCATTVIVQWLVGCAVAVPCTRRLRARLGSDAAALSTTSGAMQRPLDTTLEKLTPFESELDKKLKTVAGTHARRGAHAKKQPASKP